MLVILWIKLFHRYFISINFIFFLGPVVKNTCVNPSMDIQKVSKIKQLVSEDIPVKLNQLHTLCLKVP